MLSALYPDVNWSRIRCVGFDLDGTLYDEYSFIDQVYTAIVSDCAGLLTDPDAAGHWMRARWLEMGSSYNRIFAEAFDSFGTGGVDGASFEHRALAVFRNFNPQLSLPPRSRQLLDYLRGHYRLFLVSDGNAALQQRKFHALSLEDDFAPQDRVFTGAHGPDWHKPSARAFQALSLDCPADQAVFFGDRENDRAFAAATGMAFVPVYNLIGR